MAKYCIFRIDSESKKKVSFFEHYDDYLQCDKRCEYLNEVAIMYNVQIRYVMRKLEDYENPYTYNPFINFIYIKK